MGMERAQITELVSTIKTVEHAATSRMGNPTYRVTLDDGRSYLTETDGSIGYAATNYRPRWSQSSEPVTLFINGRGRIVNIERHG